MPTPLATVNLCIEGLAIICFHMNPISQKQEAQIAFLVEDHHELYVNFNGKRESLTFAPKDRLNLKVTNPTLPQSTYLGNPVIRSQYDPNPTSFRWIVDLEGEIHQRKLDLLTSTSRPKRRSGEVVLLTVENAVFSAGSYFTDENGNAVKILKHDGSAQKDFGFAADVARARIECQVLAGSKLLLSKTTPGQESVLLDKPIDTPSPRSICFMNIETTHRSRCDTTHPGVGVPSTAGDFYLIYKVVRDPSGKKYDLKKPEPAVDNKYANQGKLATDPTIFNPPYRVCDVNWMSMTGDLTPLTE